MAAIYTYDMKNSPVRSADPTLLAVNVDAVLTKLQLLDMGVNPRLEMELNDLIYKATDQIESDARIQIMPQTWQLYLDHFPTGELELLSYPIASLTHIKYITDDVLTTWASSNYQTDLVSAPGRVKPNSGSSWPVPDSYTLNSVQLEWIAGYASASVVPYYTKQVILAVVELMYRGCDMNEENYWPMIRRLQKFGFI